MPDLSPEERAALGRIPHMTDPARLRTLVANARTRGAAAVERAAFARLCAVQPEGEPGTMAHDVWSTIFATEELLRLERGRATRLTRTRQKIARDGEALTVTALTLSETAAQGFADLIARGHPELTFEAVVLRHPDAFSADVAEAARARLAGAGVDTSTHPGSTTGA
jgi:hypothetical protein